MRRPASAALAAALALASCARLPEPTPIPPPPEPATAPTARETTTTTPRVTPPPTPAAPAPATPANEPLISIGLGIDLAGITVVPPGLAVVQGAGEERSLEAGENLAVTMEKGHMVVRALSGDGVRWRATADAAETLWVTPVAGPGSEPLLGWNSRLWRGQFKIFVNPRRRLTLASRMTLESYLLGVVPAEIGSLGDSLLEAGRAQAIAARSYTLFYMGRRGTEGFDLYGTVEDQVYRSTDGEKPLATRCVQSTAGEVALASGRPIRANYSSTCGGITADVWEAWPADPLPYLVSHRDRPAGANAADYCSLSPHYRWREEWTAGAFLTGLARFGPQFGVRMPRAGAGRLVDVRVVERSRSGRVWLMVVQTTTGRIVIPGHALRQVIRRPGQPDAILRSCLFKVDVRKQDGSPAAVVMSGAGSGHGVGLCQTGALGMARLGARAEDIVRQYYRGVDIRKFY
jgi:stage II sporulation protein D